MSPNMFGPFRLDLRDERLWRGDRVIPMRPKTLAVLRVLVAQAGQLMTKDEILAAVWPETTGSDEALTGTIRELRRALGDQSRRPQFIETVHGRGYRFIAPVCTRASSEASALLGSPHPAPPPLFCRPPYFVGRDTAFAQLAQWWDTARRGTRQGGIIAGEPGIGKTALVKAFLAQEAEGEGCWVGHGSVSSPMAWGSRICPCWKRSVASAGAQKAPVWSQCCTSMLRAGWRRCPR